MGSSYKGPSKEEQAKEKREQEKLKREQEKQQRQFEKQLAALSHVPQVQIPTLPELPKPPAPPPPPPPPTEDRRTIEQAAYDQRLQARKRKGIGATLLAGETGGPGSNPAGGSTLLGT